MESKLRKQLAQFPAIKLFLKAGIDLVKIDMYQFRNSLRGGFHTFKCTLQRRIKNKKEVKCNICGWEGNTFYPHVNSARVVLNEKCPKCHSIPAYRLIMFFLQKELNFFEKKLKILEIGPNRSLQNLFLRHPNFDYISVDLKSPQAMYHMDVTDLKFPNNEFDFLFCVGVMHYVEDDQKGFDELYRVLKPGGQLLFARGINESAEKTEEYPERIAKNCFTVRTYGNDVIFKMEKSGFMVFRYQPYKDQSVENITYFGLVDRTIFMLEKPI